MGALGIIRRLRSQQHRSWVAGTPSISCPSLHTIPHYNISIKNLIVLNSIVFPRKINILYVLSVGFFEFMIYSTSQVSPELYGDSRPRLFTYWTVRSLIIFNSQLLINSNLCLCLFSKTKRDERKITKKK